MVPHCVRNTCLSLNGRAPGGAVGVMRCGSAECGRSRDGRVAGGCDADAQVRVAAGAKRGRGGCAWARQSVGRARGRRGGIV